jgi:prepilin peptidase CpaA
MGVVGAVLGAKGVFYAFLICAIIGGIYAVTFTFLHRQQFRGFYKELLTSFVTIFLLRKYIPDPKNSDLKKPRLCYGAAIALGTGIYIVFDLSGSSLIG